MTAPHLGLRFGVYNRYMRITAPSSRTSDGQASGQEIEAPSEQPLYLKRIMYKLPYNFDQVRTRLQWVGGGGEVGSDLRHTSLPQTLNS